MPSLPYPAPPQSTFLLHHSPAVTQSRPNTISYHAIPYKIETTTYSLALLLPPLPTWRNKK